MKQIKNRYTRKVILEVESLIFADLKGADLIRANLKGTDLIGADLRGANLGGADLRDSDLTDSDLRGANLICADLIRANLKGSDLSGTDLSGANLKGANLKDADLISAYFEGASNYYSFVAYNTSKRLVHCVKHDTTWMVLAGCFWGTLEELEKKVLDTHKSPVYLANIEILKTI